MSTAQTYLQLCQDARIECGISGTAPLPTTTVNQVGELLRLCNWVKDAYSEIQGRCPSWKWMRKPFLVNTVAHTDTYAYGVCTDIEAMGFITRFRRFWADDLWEPPTAYLTSGGVAGQRRLIWMPFDRFTRIYRFGVQRTTYGQPVYVSMDENNALVLGPSPDDIYTIEGWFQRGKQVLAADGDIPDMPPDFHKLIVYQAMRKYAGYKSAPDVLSRVIAEGNPMMRSLEQNQMPAWNMGGPLA